ncbi:kinase-like protein [Clavulina sp. PMI_390]|nr:kinase-like protein [Clavulina sp. PMI_390]
MAETNLPQISLPPEVSEGGEPDAPLPATIPIIPTIPIPDHVYARFGITREQVLAELPEEEAMALLDETSNSLKKLSASSDERPATLRLLQDCCSLLGCVPPSLRLPAGSISVNWQTLLGHGGEMIVYKGVMGNQVVVLVHREAITHSQLDHPNILRFLGIYRDGPSLPLIITPFIKRGSLRACLKSKSPYPYDQESLRRVLVGMTGGLAYLHSQRPPVIHGDLHPGNVLIDDSGEPHLCDFGFSRIRHEVSRSLTMIQEGGMTSFLAPELLDISDGKFRTNKASDMYSLAMTCMNAWSGKKPLFGKPNEPQTSPLAIEKRRPERPNSGIVLAIHVQEALWHLLEDMWAHDPADRPSGNQVLEQLVLAFAPTPVSAQP